MRHGDLIGFAKTTDAEGPSILERVRRMKTTNLASAADKTACHDEDRKPADVFALRRLSQRHLQQMEELMHFTQDLQGENHTQSVDTFFVQKGLRAGSSYHKIFSYEAAPPSTIPAKQLRTALRDDNAGWQVLPTLCVMSYEL
jgi:hypothetical protein